MARLRVIQYNSRGNYFVEITDESGFKVVLDTGTENPQIATRISNEIRREFPEAKDRMVN